MAKSLSYYIDKTNMQSFIEMVGKETWLDSFKLENPIYSIGNQYRCDFSVNGKKETVDIHHLADGSSKLQPVGIEISNALILIKNIGDACKKNQHENASCTFTKISNDIYEKLILYLNSVEKIYCIENEERQIPEHKRTKFQSDFGDSIVICYYPNMTLMFQGNPAYVLTEAMYFMSVQETVTEEDILNTQNEVYHTKKVSVETAHEALRKKIPQAYSILSPEIIKVLSPSLDLSNSNIEMEEYSCMVFPALKALEGFLLYLLLQKGIIILPPKQNFGIVFMRSEHTDNHVLNRESALKVGDASYQRCLEDIYNYFKNQRHTLFHAHQALEKTFVISNKEDADRILNEIYSLFEDVATRLIAS